MFARSHELISRAPAFVVILYMFQWLIVVGPAAFSLFGWDLGPKGILWKAAEDAAQATLSLCTSVFAFERLLRVI